MFLYVKTSFPTGENISPLVETLILTFRKIIIHSGLKNILSHLATSNSAVEANLSFPGNTCSCL